MLVHICTSFAHSFILMQHRRWLCAKTYGILWCVFQANFLSKCLCSDRENELKHSFVAAFFQLFKIISSFHFMRLEFHDEDYPVCWIGYRTPYSLFINASQRVGINHISTLYVLHIVAIAICKYRRLCKLLINFMHQLLHIANGA